jgi:hypothetical protein
MDIDVNLFPHIESRLEKVDREIHSILDDIRSHKMKQVKLADLISHIDSKVKRDVDTTRLIKSMRSKNYNP